MSETEVEQLRRDINEIYNRIRGIELSLQELKTRYEMQCNADTKQFEEVDEMVAEIRDEIKNLLFELRGKPEKNRQSVSAWVAIFASLTGMILALLKIFGVLQ